MASGYLLPLMNALQSFTNQGVVLAGGKIYTYLAGTTTPVSTFTDATLAVSNGVQITLDSAGRPPNGIWVPSGQRTKIIFKTSAGVQVGPTLDYIPGINDQVNIGSFSFVGTIADLRLSTVPIGAATVIVQGYFVAGDGGDGEFYWDAASSFADNAGTVINLTGHVGNGRWIRTNVRRMSLRAWGCKPDNGVTDNTAAVINAINNAGTTAGATGGIPEFFVNGMFGLGSTVTWAFSPRVRLIGDGHSSGFIGNFNGFLFQNLTAATDQVMFEMSNLTLENDNTGSGAGLVYFDQCVVPIRFVGCRFMSSYHGIRLTECFTTTFMDCYFGGNNGPGGGVFTRNGIGLAANSHCNVYDCDFVGWSTARCLGNAGHVGIGGRNETNGTAFLLGFDVDGSTLLNISDAFFSGIAMEGNVTSINLAVGQITFIASGMQGEYANGSQYGIRIGPAIGPDTIMQVNIGGQFFNAAMENRGKPTFLGQGSFQWSNKPRWDLTTWNGDLGHGSAAIGRNSRVGSIQAVSIAALDCRQDAQIGKNVGEKNVPITLAATTQAIAFNAGYVNADGNINTVTAVAGGTLPAATYYLLGTVINKMGETGMIVAAEKTGTTAAGNLTLAVTFTATPAAGFRRRVYIGRASGVYDGFVEGAIDSNATLNITSNTYTGISPLDTVNYAVSMAEPDAAYAVNFKFNFDAGSQWWTVKAVGGFTLNWTNGAPANAMVDWEIRR